MANSKQKAFAKAYLLDGKSKSEAYRTAYPGTENFTARQIADKADKVFNSKGVQAELRRLKGLAEQSDIITRDMILSELNELISVSKKNAYIELEDKSGPLDVVLNTKAADILIKALDRAAKMIGADAPEQIKSTVTVVMDGEFDKYAN